MKFQVVEVMVGVEMGVGVRPNLSELFYTTTVCVWMVVVAFQYHLEHTYILPGTPLPRQS